MQDQKDASAQFEAKIQNLLEHLFKNKLNGKGYAIRLIALLVLGFAISSGATSMIMTYNNSNWSLPSLLPSLLGIFAFISFIISTSLSVRRVKDIVPDASIWPYALGIVLLSFVPIISYATYLLLVILPSNYLNQEKRNQLFNKLA